MTLHPDLLPQADERIDSTGAAIRSNTTWRNMVNAALIERDKYKQAIDAWIAADKFGKALACLAEDGTRLNKQQIARCEELWNTAKTAIYATQPE